MVVNVLIDFANYFIKGIGGLLSMLFSVLPSSPFSKVDMSPLKDYLGYLNYVVPVVEIVSILTLWCSAIGIYYIYQIALRWAKAVE